MRSPSLSWLLLVAGMVMAMPLQAVATMPGRPQGLLQVLERDIGGMIEQSQALRGRLGLPFDTEGPGGRLAGIHDGDYRSTWRALRQTMLRIERNLAELRPTLRESDDRRAGEILLAMRVELSAMSLALTELADVAAEPARNEALERLDASLHSLDGAVAATWTLEPRDADSRMAVGTLTVDVRPLGAGDPIDDGAAGNYLALPESEGASYH